MMVLETMENMGNCAPENKMQLCAGMILLLLKGKVSIKGNKKKNHKHAYFW